MIDQLQALQSAGRANPIYLEGSLLPISTEAAQDLKLKDGQVVQANLHARGDQPFLMLKGKKLDLPPGVAPFREGAVWLQVRATSQGWGLLPTAAPTDSASDATLALVSRLNQLLFRPPGQADLVQLLQSNALPQLAQSLQRPDLAELLRDMRLSMSKLTPGALAKAVAAAMGAEVWLARGLPVPPQDPRQLLKKLLMALEEHDGALEDVGNLDSAGALSQIKAGLENLESNQVQAAQAQAQREMLMSLVLPFVDAEPVELVFRRPPKNGDNNTPITVNIHTRSQYLGPVWLRTQLFNQLQVDLTMWAVRPEVVDLARQNAPALTTLLVDAGLQMKSFQIVQGARPEQANDWVPSGRGMVVDFSA